MKLRGYIQNLPIRSKLTLSLLVPCVIALILAGGVVFSFQTRLFRHSFERDLVATADIVANNLADAIATRDVPGATQILRTLRAKDEIVGAILMTPDKQTFASYGRLNADAFSPAMPVASGVELRRGRAIVTKPIVVRQEQVGILQVVSDYEAVYRSLLSVIISMITVVAAVAVGVAAALSRRLQRLVSDPVLQLAETARRVAEQKDYSVRVPVEGGAEIGLLTRTFNQMLAEIQDQDAALQRASQALARQVEELQHEIVERKHAEEKLRVLHKELVIASRQAGMAEVATGVLHNVGNVLNSVNVSSDLVSQRLHRLQSDGVGRVAGLLETHRQDLGAYLAEDPKGRLVPEYLASLAAHLTEEKADIVREMDQLNRNIEHIKEIVAMQQNYARMAGVIEDLPLAGLVEDAICLNAGAFQRHGVEVRRQFGAVPPVRVDKHKVLQVLVNLLRNAKYALDDSGRADKHITVQIKQLAPDRVAVVVRDNGVGIPPENLTRIFQHGFTTRSAGHGFGLHSGALAASEMGGRLFAESEGPGQGAGFTLELPVAVNGASHHGHAG